MSQLGRLLAAQTAAAGLPVYLATDAADEAAAVAQLASTLPLPTPVVRTLPRFRTPHGSHNVAFAAAMLAGASKKLLLPYETLTTYLSADRPALAPPAQVVWEALEARSLRTAGLGRS